MAIAVNDPNWAWHGGPTGGATGAGLGTFIAADGSSATWACAQYCDVWLSMPGASSATLNFSTVPQIASMGGPANSLFTSWISVLADGNPAVTTQITGLSSLPLFSGATAGTIQTLVFPVRFVTGTALTYSTSTVNSPKYKIVARAEAQ